MSLGKKILSAFIEVEDSENENPNLHASNNSDSSHNLEIANSAKNYPPSIEISQKFKAYFENLLNESKANSPDYFAFSKMIEAMSVIPDERARYIAAFAGLASQGLSKQQLVSSAYTFLDVINIDATNFNNTINAAFEEKVQRKKNEIDEKIKKIEDLSREITMLNDSIGILKQEIKENEEKINFNSSGYKAESNSLRDKISHDVEKIKQYIN